MIFGGKPALLRRQKGLIDNSEWKSRRHQRAIEIVGDRTRKGNRHFRLSADARTCEVTFLKKKVILDLPEMNGKYGRLLRAVSKLAETLAKVLIKTGGLADGARLTGPHLIQFAEEFVEHG